jgi:hypothetical protein
MQTRRWISGFVMGAGFAFARGVHADEAWNGTGPWDTTATNKAWNVFGGTSPWINGSQATFDADNIPAALKNAPGGIVNVNIDDPSGSVVASAVNQIAPNNPPNVSFVVTASPGDTLTTASGGMSVGGMVTIDAPIAGTGGVGIGVESLVTLGGNNVYTGPTTIASGNLTLAGGSMGNTAMSLGPIGYGVIFEIGSPGAGPLPQYVAGTTGPGTQGASLAGGTSTNIEFADGAAAYASATKFIIQEQSGYTGNSLTFNHTELYFGLNDTSADEMVINGPGAASVTNSGIYMVFNDPNHQLTSGVYPLISDQGGGLGSGFTFGSTGTTTESVTVNGKPYNLSLVENNTELDLVVVPEPATLAALACGGMILLQRRRRISAPV